MLAETPLTGRILIVEDDPTFLHFWRRFLNDIDVHEYDLVDDPLKALQLLRTSPYRLLISDIILPSINGFELAKAAREKHRHIEILLTTAYSTDLTRFDPAGYQFHLVHKPYSNIYELKRLVAHMLKGEDVFSDASEDSYSDNEDYPQVTEWKL